MPHAIEVPFAEERPNVVDVILSCEYSVVLTGLYARYRDPTAHVCVFAQREDGRRFVRQHEAVMLEAQAGVEPGWVQCERLSVPCSGLAFDLQLSARRSKCSALRKRFRPLGDEEVGRSRERFESKG